MLIAIAALLFQFPLLSPRQTQATGQPGEAVASKAVDASTVSSKAPHSTSSETPDLTAEALPIAADASVAFTPGRLIPQPVAASAADPAANPSPDPIVPAPAATPVYGPLSAPVYGPPVRAVSDRRQQREWLALSFAAHSAAGFDAWSTRRVLSSVPQAQEMNPLLRPFAGNASMYAAVQVAPVIFDLLSRRMMNSRSEFLRHTWWLPQAVSAVVSVGSGIHNVGVYNSR
jgi:hypothetical protein